MVTFYFLMKGHLSLQYAYCCVAKLVGDLAQFRNIYAGMCMHIFALWPVERMLACIVYSYPCSLLLEFRLYHAME
jgi:hypothetical protein